MTTETTTGETLPIRVYGRDTPDGPLIEAGVLQLWRDVGRMRDTHLDRDVAQLRVGITGLLDEETATRTAISGIGVEPVGAALPYVQKPALTRTNRARGRRLPLNGNDRRNGLR